MISVMPFKGASPVAVSQDWVAIWKEGFRENALSDALLADDRFASRIGDLLLRRIRVAEALPPAPTGRDGAILKVLLGQQITDVLYLLGVAWKAPVLASVLPNREARERHGLTNRSILGVALAYKDHSPRAVVGALEHDHDFATEGLMCLYPWLERFDEALYHRLLLLLPILETKSDFPAERADIVERVLTDDTALKALPA